MGMQIRLVCYTELNANNIIDRTAAETALTDGIQSDIIAIP